MPAEKIPAVTVSKKAREAARRKAAAALKARHAKRRDKHGDTALRLQRLRELIKSTTETSSKAQKNLGPAIRAAIKKTETRRKASAPGKAPIAAVDAAERPLRIILKTAQDMPRKKLHALIAETLGLSKDKKAFVLDPLFPKLRKKHKRINPYWVAEFAADRRSTTAIRARIADALRRTGAFASVRPEALRMGVFSGGGTGPGFEMGVPEDRDWHLTSPDHNSPHWHGYRGGIDVYGAWDAMGLASGGADAGSGFKIGHPDTGFREHSDYPTNRIDLPNAYNAFTDRTTPGNVDPVTQNAARHGVMPRGFPYYEMHGTFTASVIVAPRTTDGSRPVRSIVGVAQGATMLPLRCVNTVILAGDIEIIAAIEHAIDEDVDVISISLGGAPNPALRDALAAAVDQGIIVVAAAGQSEGAPIPQAVAAPACYPEVIAVGGSIGPLPWEGAFHGPEVDICAPAVHIRHATFEVNGNEDWKTSSGTSFATAITAGLATMWLQAHGGRQAIQQAVPGVPVQQVFRHMLKQTAVDTTIFADDPPPGGWNTSLFGAGLVNAKALVTNSLPQASDVPPIEESKNFNVYGSASGIAILDLSAPWTLAVVNSIFTTAGQIGGFAQSAAEMAGDMWNEFAEGTADAVGGFVTSLGELAGLFDAELAAEAALGAWEDAMAAAGSVAGELGDMLEDAAEAAGEAWEDAEDAVEEALDDAEDAVDDFIEETGNFIEDTAETASETAGNVAGAVADTFGGLFG